MKTRLLPIACLVLLAAGVAHAQPEPGYPPRLDGAQEHVYKHIGDVQLKLYVFSPAADEAKAPRPAVVFFFGGGWSTGSPQQFEQQCRYLASRGIVAVTADYRVSSRHGVAGVDCVRDAKSAIRWVRGHADQWGVDPDRIVAAGGSAGGHLAACTAVIAEFDEPSEDASTSSRPNVLVLFNPVLSFDAGLDVDDPRPARFGKRMGVEPERLSPARHVAAGAPPTLILVGSQDFVLPGNKQFVERMHAAGNRCELDLYAGRTHGFFNYKRQGAESDNSDFLAAVESMDRFLASLGYLSGPPQAKTFFDALPNGAAAPASASSPGQ